MRALPSILVVPLFAFVLTGCGGVLGASSGSSGAPPPSSPSTEVAPDATPPVSPDFSRPRADLIRAIQEASAGYEELPAHEGTLEDFKPATLEVKRGTCYLAALELQEPAAFGPHAQRGVDVVTSYGDGPLTTYEDAVIGPGALVDLDCPAQGGAMTVDVQASYDLAHNLERYHELGKGAFKLRFFAKKVTEEALREREKRVLQQRAEQAEARATQAEQRAQQVNQRAQASEPNPSSMSGAPSKKPLGAVRVSLNMRNECSKKVNVFFGNNPKFGSGTLTQMTGRETTSRQFDAGSMIWLVDDSRNTLGSVTVSDAMRQVIVSANCTGISGQ